MQRAIDRLVLEHENITRVLEVMREMCLSYLEGKEPDLEEIDGILDFLKLYSDQSHHGKEEKILFQAMLDNLGEMGSSLIRNGMLVEHDLARTFVMDLKEARDRYEACGGEGAILDIMGNMMGYTYLLKRHIDKENRVVYPYAQRSLFPEIQEEVEERSDAFDKDEERVEIVKKEEAFLSQMEEKYGL